MKIAARLEPGGPERLQLESKGNAWHIRLDGEELAQLEGFGAMKRGWSTRLEDGRLLEVKTLRPVIFPELSILVDGRHAEGSPSHPDRVINLTAPWLLLGPAFFLLWAVQGRADLHPINITLEVLQVLGAVLLYRRSSIGLALVGLGLLVEFLILDLRLLFDPSWSLVWPILGRLIFLIFVVRAGIALRDVRRMRAA